MIRGDRGATLIELIFATAIMLVLTGSFYQLFASFHQNYEVQHMIAEMQQQGRVAVGLISREVRQAGYDPTGEVFDGTKKTKERWVRCIKMKHNAERIFEATPTVFHYAVDLNANSSIDNGEVGKKDIDEHIKYEWIDANGVDSCGIETNLEPYSLVRDSGGGRQGVASNIQSLKFEYYDGNGNLLATPLTTLAQREQIMKIKVTVRARTERKDPHYNSNDGYRTRKFVSEIWLKNM